ncbi:MULTISPECIES: type II toxin-antitoxin system RelE/ParE family toxin [Bacteroides]|uniref:type II toxin-antitoxin system RelE/ParE family toxin n=1 Tax=Bacteroides TaxID=816 RepID=UPI000B386381|nr:MULTISPECIES: type II toxin-antitoxin system RelE/ParE family toxin [Bacteroides]MBM6945283.1 type II toxin-antitoxin system RelE/ParE family toxin [Bacteroides gallinaceum]OUO56075.1 addiction module toxin RelE [Bacteroides sp. An279]
MKDITIKLSLIFRKEFKKLAKKYRSLPFDLERLIESIQENPIQGTDLGNKLRKIRLAITSKGKGKSGGARIITYAITVREDGIEVTLLTIYDKSDQENISDKELLDLLKQCGL